MNRLILPFEGSLIGQDLGDTLRIPVEGKLTVICHMSALKYNCYTPNKKYGYE
ncbi:MAG: hypothetical protein ACW97Z_12370 [Candidatus Hodarchaeales archaeon]|jgi:hypothetical protein